MDVSMSTSLDERSTTSASPISPEGSASGGTGGVGPGAVAGGSGSRGKHAGDKDNKRPACIGCRTIKVRCILPANEPNAVVCTRCIRLKLPCEYPAPATKGRKPRHSPSKVGEVVQGGASTSFEERPPADTKPSMSAPMPSYPPPSTTAPISSAPANPWANKPASYAPTTSVTPPMLGPSTSVSHFPPIATSRGVPAHPSMPPSSSSQPGGPYGAPANHPSVSSTGTAGSPRLSEGAGSNSARRQLVGGENAMDHSLRSLVQAAEVTMAENAAVTADLEAKQKKKGLALPGYVDPVDLRQFRMGRRYESVWKSDVPCKLVYADILGLVEAEQLFHSYHTQLNPFIKILDPHLHTMEFTRKHSPILFSAVLCVAGKFTRVDLYPQLLAHAQQLVGRALADNISHIGIVQALGILVYWKEPTDSSAWMKVGIAIRMGYQLRLHKPRTQPLPADTMEARLILDGERTWLNLVCFDKSYHLYDESEGRRVGLMIPDEKRDLDRWLQDGYPYEVEDDSLLALSVEMGRITELRRNIESCKSLGGAHALAAHLSAWLRGTCTKWTDASSPHYRCSRPEGALKMKMMNSNTNTVLIQSLLIATEFKDDAVLAEYFGRAGEFFEESLNLARSGVIDIVQDSVAVALFTAAEFLFRLFPMVNITNQTTIMLILEVRDVSTVYTTCKQVANERDTAVSAYIARFYRQVLRQISASSSIPATRPNSPQPQSSNPPSNFNHRQAGHQNGSSNVEGRVALQMSNSGVMNGFGNATPAGGPHGDSSNGQLQQEQNPFAGLGTIGDELFDDFASTTGISFLDGQPQFTDTDYWHTLLPGALDGWNWFGPNPAP
ncbi:BZ3500_MvSof-1268-A1-R1_Chr5-2g07790 [Microbotryum saponariae]|uniref:BZ3500_MvSof-1268-A1-R1_Chr5-2g07790 protein n=1 Tax=Microbotryum saponariae TaxID=289078 RepID=A0A2X0L9E4_9BASI|nr:BZ3500_MvSof-1268-A1-R1_Chr5-2g07790 [Microbotryum saponariae]SDA05659.1 BZ3501_MvSof-1269-A2-R1_Chr5-2g07612 [Microbotryum saponariae]